MTSLLKIMLKVLVFTLALNSALVPALPVQGKEVPANSSTMEVEDEYPMDENQISAANAEPKIIVLGTDPVPTMTLTDGTARPNEYNVLYAPIAQIERLANQGKAAWEWSLSIPTKQNWTLAYGKTNEEYSVDTSTPRKIWLGDSDIREPDAFMYSHITQAPDAITFFVPENWSVEIFSLHHNRVRFDGEVHDRFITMTHAYEGQETILLDHSDTPYGPTVHAVSRPAPKDGWSTLSSNDSIPVWARLVAPSDELVLCIGLDVSQDRTEAPVIASATYTATHTGFLNWYDGTAEVAVYPGQTVTNTYTDPGVYTVTAVALAPNGDRISDPQCQALIVVEEKPDEPLVQCGFVHVTTDGNFAPVNATATYSGTHPGLLNWGDNSPEIGINPLQSVQHTFNTTGTYTITAVTVAPNGDRIPGALCQAPVIVEEKPEEPEIGCLTAVPVYDYSNRTISVTTTGTGTGWKMYVAGNPTPIQQGTPQTQPTAVPLGNAYVIQWHGTDGIPQGSICPITSGLVLMPFAYSGTEAYCSAISITEERGEGFVTVTASVDGYNVVDNKGRITWAGETKDVALNTPISRTFTVSGTHVIEASVNGPNGFVSRPACRKEVTLEIPPASCSKYGASLANGSAILNLGAVIDVWFDVAGVSSGMLNGVVAIPVNGVLNFPDTYVLPNEQLMPTLTDLQGNKVPAGPACSLSYVPASEEIEGIIKIYHDPFCIVVTNPQEGVYDFTTATFRSVIAHDHESACKYTSSLSSTDQANLLRAISAGLIGPNDQWMVNLGFAQLRGSPSSDVFHDMGGFVNPTWAVGVYELGSSIYGEPNSNAIYANIHSTDALVRRITAGVDPVGTQILTEDGIIVLGTFYDDLSPEGIPTIAMRNACVGMSMAKERSGSREAPDSAVMEIWRYSGCDSRTWSGFLAPLFNGMPTIASNAPNSFKQTVLLPGWEIVTAANLAQVVIEFVTN